MIEAVVFPCTYRCDGRCIMCTIHERRVEDLPVSFFEKVFMSPELKNLKTINITGGEPTLREDLSDLIKMITRNCKDLREIIINSNGLNPERIINQVGKIVGSCEKNVKYWVNISLDALDFRADIIRGLNNCADRAIESLKGLKELEKVYSNLHIGISCIIVSINTECLKEVYEYARNNDFFIDFIYATKNSAYINSESKYEKFTLNGEQKTQVISFLESLENFEKIGSAKRYYKKLVECLQGNQINKECIFRDGKGVLIEADGKVRVCGMTEDSYLGDLNDESISKILSRSYPSLENNCKICETNSYYNWSAEAQDSIKQEMLQSIKLKLRIIRQ